MLIGAHVPTSGGYAKMVDYATTVGCECIQIFAKSPRQWNAKPMDPAVAASLHTLREQAGLGPVLTHTSYLINLSTDKEELREKSIDALADEITRGTMLGADSVNTHVGNDPAGDMRGAAARAADAIVQAFERAGGVDTCARLVLENSAGAGSTFGTTIEELALILEKANLPEKSLGICIDTCHAWAAGYDMSSKKGWGDLTREIDGDVGLKRFRWIHANDCKFGRGLKKDRHEWIGDGEIGIAGFAALFEMDGIDHVNIVTEMPGEVPEKDRVNIERLKMLRDEVL